MSNDRRSIPELAAELATAGSRYRPEVYVSLTMAAQLLGLSRKALYNRLTDGKLGDLHPTKIFGRWRIPRPAIEQLYAQGEQVALGLVRGGKGFR